MRRLRYPEANIKKKTSKFSNQTVALLVEKQSWVWGKESKGERKTRESKSALQLVEFNLTLFRIPLLGGGGNLTKMANF